MKRTFGALLLLVIAAGIRGGDLLFSRISAEHPAASASDISQESLSPASTAGPGTVSESTTRSRRAVGAGQTVPTKDARGSSRRQLAAAQQPDSGQQAQNSARQSLSRRRKTPSAPPDYLRDPLRYLSTAPVDSLVLLPGIGPIIAQRLARARTGKRLFTRWDELLSVKGIGPKKLERLKNLAVGNN
jgi:predicted flap endonuclease-1-like 5' DNA nuclease